MSKIRQTSWNFEEMNSAVHPYAHIPASDPSEDQAMAKLSCAKEWPKTAPSSASVLSHSAGTNPLLDLPSGNPYSRAQTEMAVPIKKGAFVKEAKVVFSRYYRNLQMPRIFKDFIDKHKGSSDEVRGNILQALREEFDILEEVGFTPLLNREEEAEIEELLDEISEQHGSIRD